MNINNYSDLPLTLSVNQVAKILGISRNVAYEMVKKENLAIRVGSKRLVCPRERLVQYLQNA